MLAIRPNQRPQSGEQLRAVLDGRAADPAARPARDDDSGCPGALRRRRRAADRQQPLADATRINTALPADAPADAPAPRRHRDQRATTTFSPTAPMPTARQTPIDAPTATSAGPPCGRDRHRAATANPPPARPARRIDRPRRRAAARRRQSAPAPLRPRAGRASAATPPRGRSRPRVSGTAGRPRHRRRRSRASAHRSTASQRARRRRSSQPASWAGIASGDAAARRLRSAQPPAGHAAAAVAAGAARGGARPRRAPAARGAAKSWLVLAGGGLFVAVAALAAWQFSGRRDRGSRARPRRRRRGVERRRRRRRAATRRSRSSSRRRSVRRRRSPTTPTKSAPPPRRRRPPPPTPAAPRRDHRRPTRTRCATPAPRARPRVRPPGKPVPRARRGSGDWHARTTARGTTRPSESRDRRVAERERQRRPRGADGTPPRDRTAQRPPAPAEYGGQSTAMSARARSSSATSAWTSAARSRASASSPECVAVLASASASASESLSGRRGGRSFAPRRRRALAGRWLRGKRPRRSAIPRALSSATGALRGDAIRIRGSRRPAALRGLAAAPAARRDRAGDLALVQPRGRGDALSRTSAAYLFFGRALSYRRAARRRPTRSPAGCRARASKAGDRVAVFMQNCPQFPVALYAHPARRRGRGAGQPDEPRRGVQALHHRSARPRS